LVQVNLVVYDIKIRKLSDFLSLIAIAISLLTLFSTIYLQFFKRSKIIIQSGDITKIYKANDDKVFLIFDLCFFNYGARYSGIYKVDGYITNKSENYKKTIIWQDFVKEERISGDDEPLKINTLFDGRVSTIIIPGYQAVNKTIEFFTIDQFHFTPGFYEVKIISHQMISKRNFSYTYNFRLDGKSCEFIENNCKADINGIYKISCELRREY
jgi:hypothetical protein